MSLLEKARVLESRIARALSQAAENAVGPSVREPLEIVHAIVETVEGEIQSGGRGTRVFPFNNIVITLLAPTRAAQARYDAVLSGEPTVRERIVERLRSAHCDVDGLRVEVGYAEQPLEGWRNPQFHVAFASVELPPAPAPIEPLPVRVEIAVLRGTADRRTYAFAAARIDFGRGVEVRDRRNRLLRTNHVVFVEGSTAENLTVSRRHAHLVCHPPGDYRLHDDGSEHGTSIVRGGRSIPVPPGSRGVRVRSGDEIVLGEARVRIRIEPPRAAGPMVAVSGRHGGRVDHLDLDTMDTEDTK